MPAADGASPKLTGSVDLEGQVRSGLESLIGTIDPKAQRLDHLERLSGGATQEIWRFDLMRSDGERRYILRRAPGGDYLRPQNVGLEVEAQLISAAAAVGAPAPPVYHVLRPSDGLGHGFIMGFVDGETLGGRIVRSDHLQAARHTLARDCGAVLAKIHSIDVQQFPMLMVAAPAELVETWRTAYRAQPVVRPVFEAALRWLSGSAPPSPAQPALVHGDFRNGNLMIGPDGVRAVLDWELAHIGDPMEDLGWLCVNSWRFGQIDRPVGGFGQYEDLYAGYEAAGGRRVDRDAAKWWEVFGTLRWGVMCAGAIDLFRTIDPDVERALIARRASETEIDLLRLLES